MIFDEKNPRPELLIYKGQLKRIIEIDTQDCATTETETTVNGDFRFFFRDMSSFEKMSHDRAIDERGVVIYFVIPKVQPISQDWIQYYDGNNTWRISIDSPPVELPKNNRFAKMTGTMRLAG